MSAALETVFSRSLRGRDAEDYDAFVDAAPGGHAAQARGWARVACAGGRFVPRYFLARESGAVVGAALVLRPAWKGLAAPLAIVERGPVVADPADLERVLRALVRALRRRGIVRTSAMPYFAGDQAERAEQALRAARFRDVQEVDGAHASTLRLDLTPKGEDEILAGKDKKKLRYELRHAEKSGAASRRGKKADYAILARLSESLAASQGKRPKPAAWFEAIASYYDETDRGALFVCEHDGAAVSAVLVSRHGRQTTFLAGASIPEPRPFSKMALPLLDAIRWARASGSTLFDLGGIPLEEDTDAKRAAIAQFKFDFAKTPVRLVREHARLTLLP